jgi:serine/threonine protein phosphatase 1
MAAGERSGWLRHLVGQKSPPSKVPDGTRVYAVGDIHGRWDLLERLLAQIGTHASDSARRNSLIFLGDYVDRGPQSKGVIDYLLQLDWPGWEIVTLRGNHDQAVIDFVDDPRTYRAWRAFGAAETLVSYDVKPPVFENDRAFVEARDEFVGKCPTAHMDFLRSLKLSHVVGDYMFVHAGVRPGIALDQQSAEDLMWIRDDFLSSNLRLDKIIVHGHTPDEHPVLRRNRICVDTGAYATGCLTAVVLDGEGCTFLSTVGS